MAGDEKVLDYWQKMAKWALPFLIDRKVAIELKLGEYGLYKRHPKDDKSKWLFINSEDDIIDWADKHAWSFHPHVLGQKDLWFVTDIDERGKGLDLEIVKKVAWHLAGILDKAGIAYLVKFSGNRGFHFMWKWNMDKVKISGEARWNSAQDVVLKLRDLLEAEIVDDVDLRSELQKLVGPECPFVITNAVEPSCKEAVLLDANILHENANIRSPFSVHLKTGLASVPLKNREAVLQFEISEAERYNVVGQEWGWVKMPVNKWNDVQKALGL